MQTGVPASELELSTTLQRSGIVAVLRASSVSACLPAIRVLADSGISDIELTMTIPGLLDEFSDAVTALPGVTLGVGTVTTEDEARRAIGAGAKFIVTPVLAPDVVVAAREKNVPVYPGALTPTEIHQAWILGATAVKVFPAASVGPRYLEHLHGPFPALPMLPSGGIGLEHIPDWIRAGAVAVSLGGPLIGDSLAGGSLSALADRAATALEAVRTGRSR